MQQYQITFNGNRLDTIPGVDLYNYDFTALPERDVNIHKLARRSLSIITSSEYTQKTIPVWMDICSGDRQATEATVTYLKSIIQGQNGKLQVLQGGLVVNYTATMNEFNITWDSFNAYVQVVFLASTPIGTGATRETLMTLNGVTLPSANQTFTVKGSFSAEPVITVVFNAVTGGTGASVSLTNAINNQGITITGNFTAGSILEVDSANMRVTLNGGNMDFTGLFPVFSSGVSQLAYSDTATTRNVDITATYNQRLI